MNARKTVSLLILLSLFFVVVVSAQTQPAGAPRSPRPQVRPRTPTPAAMLKQYLADLQAMPDDRALREKAIAFVQSMKTPPAVPQAAQDELAKGTEAVKQTDQKAFQEAATHFNQAALLAPWLPEAYFNLGLVDEKLEKFEDARAALSFYLLAAPNAADAEGVRNRIAQLAPEKRLEQAEADLQKNPTDDLLREKIIKLAQQINPAPAVPEDALRASARGRAAIELAHSPEDLKEAVAELEKAVQAAPWLASVYSNLAIAQDKVGDYGLARRNLRFCLLATSNDRDATDIKKMMYEVEYKQQKADKERAQKAAEEAAIRQQEEQKQAMIEGLNGKWGCAQGCTGATVTVQGETFRINPEGVSWSAAGVRKDFNVEGTVYFPGEHVDKTNCDTPPQSNRFTGTISEDGSKITIRTQFDMYMTHALITGGLLFRRVQCDDMHVDHKEALMFVLARR